ncbi:thaumatin-like protein [Thelephora terrestris]|uniref:Thaumatin-like protein n=1 Tax=Thelephora terrestris TaxID=56493 RepID=A0A9P6H5S2_9AGAM|nr:thaumatin-like protein [Thelephora terrestris]
MKVCSLKRNVATLAMTVTSSVSPVSTTPALPSQASGNVGPGSSRTFTVTNHCPFTIWPALYTDLNVAKSVPSQPTGWEQASGTTVTFTAPYNWTAGRIWGRTECNFSVNPGPNSCATGGCNGGLLCDPNTGTGIPPVSVAEWTLGVNGLPDYYDVSLVDGSNLPMTVTSNKGCPTASCPVDLNPACPSGLAYRDPSGVIVGCKSACFANLSGNPANSPNCCSGSFNTPQTCPASGVSYYHYFKDQCPNAYAYAYDESSGTALWTCDSNLSSDYTLVFCP